MKYTVSSGWQYFCGCQKVNNMDYYLRTGQKLRCSFINKIKSPASGMCQRGYEILSWLIEIWMKNYVVSDNFYNNVSL